MDRLVEGQWRKDYPKPEAEKSIIQKNILEVRPDILVIQEIGGKGFLNELKEDLKELGLDYSYSLLMKGEDPVRLTAVLSQLKPRYIKEHDDLGIVILTRSILLNEVCMRWDLFMRYRLLFFPCI